MDCVHAFVLMYHLVLLTALCDRNSCLHIIRMRTKKQHERLNCPTSLSEEGGESVGPSHHLPFLTITSPDYPFLKTPKGSNSPF